MDLFARATPEPPHALRQHFAVNSHDCDTHIIYSVAPMQFGGSHISDATHYNPHTAALAEVPPDRAAAQAVLYIAPHSPSEPFTNRHWNLVAQLAESELRVEVPIPHNSAAVNNNDALTNKSTRYEIVTLLNKERTHAPHARAIRETYLKLAEDHGPERVTIIAESSCIPELFGALPGATAPRSIVLLAPQAKDVALLTSPTDQYIPDTELHVFFSRKHREGADIVCEASKLIEGRARIHVHEGASGDRLYHLKRSKAGRTARKAIISVAHNTAARDI